MWWSRKPKVGMTEAEMKAAHPNEWVLAERVTLDRRGHMATGNVLAHGPDRTAILKAWDTLPKPAGEYDRGLSVFYTGPIDHDVLDWFL